jgi:hypothetical protein
VEATVIAMHACMSIAAVLRPTVHHTCHVSHTVSSTALTCLSQVKVSKKKRSTCQATNQAQGRHSPVHVVVWLPLHIHHAMQGTYMVCVVCVFSVQQCSRVLQLCPVLAPQGMALQIFKAWLCTRCMCTVLVLLCCCKADCAQCLFCKPVRLASDSACGWQQSLSAAAGRPLYMRELGVLCVNLVTSRSSYLQVRNRRASGVLWVASAFMHRN